MSLMLQDLEWSPCTESLEDIIANPRVHLPQLIKLSSSVTGVNLTRETLEREQIVLLHDKITVTKFEAYDEKDNKIYLPVNCPYPVQLKLPRGKEKSFDAISDVAKADPLPKFVEITRIEGLESVSLGDRLKVVIVEKSGSVPTFIHFRTSSGKHVKISVDQEISFRLAVNDAADKMLTEILSKSMELPVNVQFVENSNVPKTHLSHGMIKISKIVTENVVLASAIVGTDEYAFTFPENLNFQFQVNTKLKLAKDQKYRELCSNYSEVDSSEVEKFLYGSNPSDAEMLYIIKYNNLLKYLQCKDSEKETKLAKIQLPENILHIDTEQRDIVRKEQKEKDYQLKLEKEKMKAELKRQKKERKEKEKEERKKKKLSKSTSTKSLVIEKVDEEMYIVPVSPDPSLTGSPNMKKDEDVDFEDQSQWSRMLMQVKKVRDRAKSTGSQKNKKFLKNFVFKSNDNIADDNFEIDASDPNDGDYYETFSESLYEELPINTAYESLDLIKHTQRTFKAGSTENSGDSGFDEADQSKIRKWRESMNPPPLPANHPLEGRHPRPVDDTLYEVAVDSQQNVSSQMQSRGKRASQTALKDFYNFVHQSTVEIAAWDLAEVANCLQDLNLSHYTAVFSDSLVDGQLLLDLDESVLNDLGLTIFEARKLRKFCFGWRPDCKRPQTYPRLKGFAHDDPSEWSEDDVVDHLKAIEIYDLAEFCKENQVNGDLLKDICVDDVIMNSVISTKDRKIKIVKVKSYVIDNWRPKKNSTGNYGRSAPLKTMSVVEPKTSSILTNLQRSESSSPGDHRRFQNKTEVVSKKSVSDAPLVARMKMQLEERKNDWENRR